MPSLTRSNLESVASWLRRSGNVDADVGGRARRERCRQPGACVVALDHGAVCIRAIARRDGRGSALRRLRREGRVDRLCMRVRRVVTNLPGPGADRNAGVRTSMRARGVAPGIAFRDRCCPDLVPDAIVVGRARCGSASGNMFSGWSVISSTSRSTPRSAAISRARFISRRCRWCEQRM